MSLLHTLKEKVLAFNKKSDELQEKITFSEANVHDHQVSEPLTCSLQQHKNLVVACHDSRFSSDMMDYAIEMADRMGFGIIAINAANLTHDMTEFFSTTQEKLFEDFKETSQQTIEPFRAKALDAGLEFAHTVKFSDIDNAIKEVSKECKNIDFIITENKEPAAIRDGARNDKRIAQRMFVYSMN